MFSEGAYSLQGTINCGIIPVQNGVNFGEAFQVDHLLPVMVKFMLIALRDLLPGTTILF
jgi:hypothetical protein